MDLQNYYLKTAWRDWGLTNLNNMEKRLGIYTLSTPEKVAFMRGHPEKAAYDEAVEWWSKADGEARLAWEKIRPPR